VAYFNVLGFLFGTEKDGLRYKGKINVGKGVFQERYRKIR